MKKLIFVGMVLLFSLGLNAQVITVGLDQNELLRVDAGMDTLMCKTHSVILGAENTALGGSEEYFYSWYPDVYLDDHTSPNPSCTPVETTTYVLTVTDSKGCTTMDYVTVAIDPCLGINDIINNADIVIYPNPVTDKFTISGLPGNGGKLELKLMNQLGQVVFHETMYSSGTEEVFDMSSNQLLNPGIYLLQIRNGTQIIVKTIHII